MEENNLYTDPQDRLCSRRRKKIEQLEAFIRRLKEEHDEYPPISHYQDSS